MDKIIKSCIKQKKWLMILGSDLTKYTCKQIWFYNTYPDKRPKITEFHIAGSQFHLENAKSPYIEMGSSYETNRFKIPYCIDEIVLLENNNCAFIEYKNVNTPPNYFLEKSILQTIWYETLNHYSKKEYITANFHTEKGNPKLKLDLKDFNVNSFLILGNTCVSIEIKDYNKIRDFYLNKYDAAHFYESAENFDAKYKSIEFKTLSNYFNFEYIEKPEFYERALI